MGTDKRIASPSPDFRVMIRNAQGHYLARDDHGLFFTNDRAAAMKLRAVRSLQPNSWSSQ